MERDVLQVFASVYVTESEMSVRDKVELINFIRVSEKDDILLLLATGRPNNILKEDISVLIETEIFIESLVLQELPFTKQVPTGKLKNIFTGPFGTSSSTPVTKTKLTGAGKGVLAAVVVAAIAAGAYMIYKRYFSKAAKACKGKSGDERSACIKQFKRQALQAQIAALKSGMSKCAQSKNPDKCKAAIQQKVQKLQAKGR